MNCACLACYSEPAQIRDFRTPICASAIPILVTVISIALAVCVIPRFESIYEQVDVPMPGLTLLCLALVKAIRWLSPLWFAGSVTLGYLIARRVIRPGCGYAIGIAALGIWIMGTYALFLPLIGTLQSIGGR